MFAGQAEAEAVCNAAMGRADEQLALATAQAAGRYLDAGADGGLPQLAHDYAVAQAVAEHDAACTAALDAYDAAIIKAWFTAFDMAAGRR